MTKVVAVIYDTPTICEQIRADKYTVTVRVGDDVMEVDRRHVYPYNPDYDPFDE